MNQRTQSKTITAAANTALELAWESLDDRRWTALLVSASVSAGSAVLTIVERDDADVETVIWQDLVAAGPPHMLPFGAFALRTTQANRDLLVRLAAAGVGNVGRLNAVVLPE